MLDCLLHPASISDNNLLEARKKNTSCYLGNEKKSTFTLKDVINCLKQTAALFEDLERGTDAVRAEVCQIIKGNLLFIAIDHLTNNPTEPLQDAEKRCIKQILLIIGELYEDEQLPSSMRERICTIFIQLCDVMTFFNLWKSQPQDETKEDNGSNKIQPSRNITDKPYDADPQIENLIKNLENSKETSLKVNVVAYDENHDYYGTLNSLIGLQGVKEVLNKQIVAFRFQQERQKRHPDLKNKLSFNCIFLGNPGTGKTTVARELAGVLRHEGLLKSGHYVEVKASDIVSPYIGVSGKNAQLAIYKAIDGLLFIDEAYALAGHNGTSSSASNDIIDTLTPLLENYRDRLCVVLAGYGNEMNKMIEQTNSGFSSRFQNIVHFDNYNAKEMQMIFELMAGINHLQLPQEVKERTQQVFECFEEAISHIPTFANARTIRNFSEKIEARMGERCISNHASSNMDIDNVIISDTELTDAEIWSVLGVIKQSASNIPFKGNDYINHLRELLSLNPKATTTQPKLLLSEHKINKHYGIIMTDTKQLAIKFYDRLRIETQVPDGSSSEIYTPDYIKSGIFMPYIQAMRSKGIIYTLLDVSDPEFNDILSNECNWQNCLKILDRFCDNHPEYIGGNLFIVGGDDVIPSPKVCNPHWLHTEEEKAKDIYYRDKDLEVDLLYSYRSEDIRFTKHLELDYEHLFCSNRFCRFAVGRLPMENGVVSENRKNEILNYFNRAIESFVASNTNSLGIEINNHLVTAAESLNAVSHIMTTNMPLLPLREEARLVEGNIFISPTLVIPNTDNINEIVQNSTSCQRYADALRKADMLTFVSHGASTAENDGCYGEDKRRENFYTAFIPELFQICPAKIVGSVCCWGARYINYRVEESMVLTALSKDVLIYVGACRSALGVFDTHIEQGYDLKYAPVLLSKFEQNLLNGIPAGLALHNAKMDYLKSQKDGIKEGDLLTILEFNLYGDPALSLTQSSQFTEKHELSQYTPTEYDKQSFTKIKERLFEIEKACDLSEMSLLDRIRQHTNANLMYIRERINKEVYQQFGLQPHELSSIVTIKTKGEADGYIFQYKRDCTNFEQITFVQTNSNGEITSVFGTL